ncbi:hypothetical protein AHiyo8_03410 [Arthrobacter sp. Hiyo8]|nr:hypothetical protein AHiyo8_03410 [Arthrobacter sp. Hiyo8]
MPTATRRMARTHQPRSGVNRDRKVKKVNRTTHQKKALRRPILSARRPHMMAPRTVPSPEQARMTPASRPVRCHGTVNSETTKPMRNMSKNSEMLPRTTSPMRLFWCPVRGRESICCVAVRAGAAVPVGAFIAIRS